MTFVFALPEFPKEIYVLSFTALKKKYLSYAEFLNEKIK